MDLVFSYNTLYGLLYYTFWILNIDLIVLSFTWTHTYCLKYSIWLEICLSEVLGKIKDTLSVLQVKNTW